MNIIIKESGARHTLSIIDPESGVNYIQDFIGNAGALIDGQFEYDDDQDAFVCDQATFDWWIAVVSDNQSLNDRIHDLKQEHGFDAVTAVIGSSGIVDLEDYAPLENQALDQAFGVDNSHIEQWRANMGWTQREAARQLGIALNSFQELERGKRFKDGAPVYVSRRTALALTALERHPELHL